MTNRRLFSFRFSFAAPLRSVLFYLALVSAGMLALSGAPATASDFHAEEIEISSVSDPRREKAAVCNPNGVYCQGYFDDLVSSIRYQRITLPDGSTSRIQVWLQPDAVAYATTVCTPYQNHHLVVRDDDPMADIWSARLDIAQALGHSLRLDWFEGPSGYCELRRIYQPYG